jgi:hypothetical protein
MSVSGTGCTGVQAAELRAQLAEAGSVSAPGPSIRPGSIRSALTVQVPDPGTCSHEATCSVLRHINNITRFTWWMERIHAHDTHTQSTVCEGHELRRPRNLISSLFAHTLPHQMPTPTFRTCSAQLQVEPNPGPGLGAAARPCPPIQTTLVPNLCLVVVAVVVVIAHLVG